MINDMICNRKRKAKVTELFIRSIKLKIYLVFIMQSYFKVLKDIGLGLTYDFIIKAPNKRELLQIKFNHLSDTNFKGFMRLNKKGTAKPY